MNRAGDRALWLVVSACLLFAAAPASAQGRELAPPTSRHHADYGLLAAGATTLSLAWTAATIGALSGFSGPANPSIDPGEAYGIALIPVIGPAIWGGMLLDHPLIRAPHLAVLAFVDSAAQLVGLAMLLAGLVGVDELSPEIAAGVQLFPTASLEGAGVMMAVEI